MAHTTIVAPYKAFSREKLPARLGAHIGLMHVNVTLTGKFIYLLNIQTHTHSFKHELNMSVIILISFVYCVVIMLMIVKLL